MLALEASPTRFPVIKMRILYITPYVPSLIRVRPYNLIRSLAQRGQHITLLSVSSSAQEEKGANRLTEWCQRVETIPVSRTRSLWNCVKALPQPGLPLQAVYSFSPRMQKRIQTLLKEEAELGPVLVEHRGWQVCGPARAEMMLRGGSQGRGQRSQWGTH